MARWRLAVTFRYPISVCARGRTLHVRQRPGGPLARGTRVVLRPGQCLECEGRHR